LRILRVNKAAVSFFKLPPEEIVGQHCYTLMHCTDAPGARTLSTKQREDLELYDEKRKAWFLVTTHPIMDGGEEVFGAVHVVKDITERKLAEAAARESEDRFRLMSDAAPVMLWISDLERRCTYFNTYWLEFRGRTMAQELGDGWEEGVHPDDLRRCHDTYTEALNARQPFRLEFRLRRFDGEYRWVLETGVPRLDAAGELSGFIGSCVDITDRKRAEEDLQNLSGRMIQGQEEERQRVARELHDDVSQHLALVAIDLEQLAQSPPASQSELAERIQAIWSETQEVASDIHRLSRQLHPSKLEDLGLVAAVRSHCQELERRGGLKIALAFHDVPRSVPPDVALCLYRVMQESLRNIIKHSGAERAEVELSTDPKAIYLRVSDSGAGFDLETVLARARGLGLVSMRERLRSVGGEINIYSKPAQGTRVEVSIPLRESADQLLSRATAV
jgi:PAS domain S-box-containing protein